MTDETREHVRGGLRAVWQCQGFLESFANSWPDIDIEFLKSSLGDAETHLVAADKSPDTVEDKR